MRLFLCDRTVTKRYIDMLYYILINVLTLMGGRYVSTFKRYNTRRKPSLVVAKILSSLTPFCKCVCSLSQYHYASKNVLANILKRQSSTIKKIIILIKNKED